MIDDKIFLLNGDQYDPLTELSGGVYGHLTRFQFRFESKWLTRFKNNRFQVAPLDVLCFRTFYTVSFSNFQIGSWSKTVYWHISTIYFNAEIIWKLSENVGELLTVKHSQITDFVNTSTASSVLAKRNSLTIHKKNIFWLNYLSPEISIGVYLWLIYVRNKLKRMFMRLCFNLNIKSININLLCK